MKNNSRISKRRYIILLALFSIVEILSIYNILPLVVYVQHYEKSMLLIVLCTLLVSSIEFMLNYLINRRYKNIFLAFFSGAGLYIFITMSKFFSVVAVVMLVMALVLSVILIVMIFSVKIKTKDHFKRINVVFNRIYRSFRVTAYILSIVLMLGSIVFPVLSRVKPSEKYKNACKYYYVKSVMEKSSEPVYSEETLVVSESYGEEYSYENNLDKIKLIRNDKTYIALSYEEKCDVIETVVAAEAKEIGLFKIEVKYDELNENACAFYNHKERSVTFNTLFVNKCTSASYMLYVILHELRHCWQNMVSDVYVKASPEEKNLLLFRDTDVAQWAENINDYINANGGEDAYEAYAKQPIEADADEWADKRCIMVYEKIDRLLIKSSDGIKND